MTLYVCVYALQFASWLSECTLHGAWCGMDKNNMATVGHSWWFGPILLGAQSKHSASDNQLANCKFCLYSNQMPFYIISNQMPFYIISNHMPFYIISCLYVNCGLYVFYL